MLGTVLDAEDAKIRVYSPVGGTDIEANFKLVLCRAGRETEHRVGGGGCGSWEILMFI